MFKILSLVFASESRLPFLTYRNFSNNRVLITNKTPQRNFKRRTPWELGRRLWMIKTMHYMKQYENNVEKRFPKMKLMRVFNTGLKELYFDIKKYISIKKKQKHQGLQALTRDELELSFKLPRELLKVSPVLIISAVPFTNYVVFPLIYFFPRVFLVSYFWTLQQRLDFFLYDYKRKLKYNKPVLRCLQAQKPDMPESPLKTKWKGIIASLGSGTHPAPSDLLACKQLFIENPYSLNCLRSNHVNELLSMHNMSRWRPYRRKRLLDRGMLIKTMDNAILKEGVSNIPIEALKWVVAFRGLNPVNMSTESMQEWLNQWLIISSEVDKSSISLLLHCPILLAYNHPSNWTLLYRKV